MLLNVKCFEIEIWDGVNFLNASLKILVRGSLSPRGGAPEGMGGAWDRRTPSLRCVFGGGIASPPPTQSQPCACAAALPRNPVHPHPTRAPRKRLLAGRPLRGDWEQLFAFLPRLELIDQVTQVNHMKPESL